MEFSLFTLRCWEKVPFLCFSPKATSLIARPRSKEMIGRRLSQEEAKKLLGKFE